MKTKVDTVPVEPEESPSPRSPAKAKAKLGWEPEITFEAMVDEMMEADLLAARKSVLIKNADWS